MSALDLFTEGYVTTQPALAKIAAQGGYGGVTGRPRKLKGHLTLLDGRRFWLGEIAVKFDGWGDGCVTDVELCINASEFEEKEQENE